MFVLYVFEGEDFVREMNVVVMARWTVNIGLDSLVVEHLTSDAAEVPGSNPGPAIYFYLYFFVFVHFSQSYYIVLLRCVWFYYLQD